MSSNDAQSSSGEQHVNTDPVLVGQAKQVIHWCKPRDNTLFANISGAIGASIFSFVYILAPTWILTALVTTAVAPFWYGTLYMWIPLVLSMILPVTPSIYLLQSWPLKYLPVYFDFTEIMEATDEEVAHLMQTRRAVFAAQPHGVFTMGGACSGITWSKRFWSPHTCPTAVANAVIQTPFIRHVVGLFGLSDASSTTLKRTLKSKSVVLYPGGIAELFLTDHKDERLYAKKRKGFVKVALDSGADIIPCYIFGNTQVLKIAKGKWLRKFARATGVSITWFWGIAGSPIPLKRKIVMVVGKPMNIPHISNPTQEDIDKYHTVYVSEVQRIFDTYKHTNPDFVNKVLQFEE